MGTRLRVPGHFDPENPTQPQIDAVSAALQEGLNDPVARDSGYIMTKMVMRALIQQGDIK